MDSAQLALPPALTRVIVQHDENFFALLGLYPIEECVPVITLVDSAGEERSFFRALSKHAYVLYKPSISFGVVDHEDLHESQQ